MKNATILLCIFLLQISCNKQSAIYKDSSQPVENRVKDLLKHMTLEEKAAQLDMMDAGSILANSSEMSLEKMEMLHVPPLSC